MTNQNTIRLKHILSNGSSYEDFEEYEILHEENGVKLLMLEHGYASISLYNSGVILGFIDEQDNIYDCTHHNLYTDNHSVQEMIDFVFDKHDQNTVNGITFKQTKLF